MKTYAFLLVASVICLSFTLSFAQSRRGSPQPENEKLNKRPPKPAESPTPQPAETQPSETEFEQDASVQTDGDVLRVDTELVTIPVKISDRKGRFIGGLTKADFQVFEDNAPQEIAYFSNEQQPFTVALILDMSYSTTFKIAEIQQAAMAFVAQLRENDKVMVISFDEVVHVLCPPTNDRKVLQTAIRSTKIASGTSLYDAVDLVINDKFRKINGRKAIVLFTDGVDTSSRKVHNLKNLSDALEIDVLIYPIQYDTFSDVQAIKNKPIIVPPTQPSPIPSKNKSPFPFPLPTGGVGTPNPQGTSADDYRKADEYLNEMANRTGGRLYKANSTANLALAFSNIAAELREYYSLGYYPKEDAKTDKKRKIKVRVKQTGLVVRARDGYVVGKKVKSEK